MIFEKAVSRLTACLAIKKRGGSRGGRSVGELGGAEPPLMVRQIEISNKFGRSLVKNNKIG